MNNRTRALVHLKMDGQFRWERNAHKSLHVFFQLKQEETLEYSAQQHDGTDVPEDTLKKADVSDSTAIRCLETAIRHHSEERH